MTRARNKRNQVAPSALALAVLTISLVACGGGSGGGGGGGSSSGGTARGEVRMVGIDRAQLSPSASSKLWLVCELPRGTQAGALALEQSADGVTFTPSGAAPVAVLARAAQWELDMPTGARWYRLAAPKTSNAVRVQGATGAQAPVIAEPLRGAAGVAHTPWIRVQGTSLHKSFLYALVDEAGAIVWLAESSADRHGPGGSGGTTFIDHGALDASKPHLATVIGIDAWGWGVAAANRVDFTTAP